MHLPISYQADQSTPQKLLVHSTYCIIHIRFMDALTQGIISNYLMNDFDSMFSLKVRYLYLNLTHKQDGLPNFP